MARKTNKAMRDTQGQQQRRNHVEPVSDETAWIGEQLRANRDARRDHLTYRPFEGLRDLLDA